MNQLTLFNPVTFEENDNWGYQIYSLGDRIYHTGNHQLGNISQINPNEIRVSWDNGENTTAKPSTIAHVKTSGYGFKSGDRVRLSPETSEFFNLSEDFLGTVKEFFGNSISVDWDDHNDEIISITFPDWIEKI